MATIRSNLGRYHGKLLKDCAEFVLEKFCPKLSDKINITFTSVENLRQTEKISADCGSLERDYRGRDFEVRVDSMFFDRDPEELIEIVMHELVHLKQCALGEHYSMFHKQSGRVVWKWNGEIFDFDENNSTDDDAYWESPWEIEAFGRSPGLVRMFFNRNPHWAEELKIDFANCHETT